MSQAGSGDPEVGSLGEETAKLLGALAAWARDHDVAGQVGAWSHRGAGDGPQPDEAQGVARGEHPVECRFCPLCRAVHAVRQVSPEARAHLLVAVTSLAKAGEALLRTEPPEPGTGKPDREHIDLDGWDEPAGDQ